MTLTLLEELKVFNYPDEIMDISGQASSEYSLELLLKKVEDTWNDLEYIVLPHKDAKDVYILGTLEDIQVALDESNINVATILSSRHVGPIKPRVEEWARMLDQFAKTLVRHACRILKTIFSNIYICRRNGLIANSNGCT